MEVKRVDTDLAPIQERQRSELIAYVESVIPTVEAMESREGIKEEQELGAIVAEGTAINRTKALIEQIRKTAKAPWLAGGQAVDGLVNPIKLRFEAAATKGKRLIKGYHDKIAAAEVAEERKREDARIAEEKRREGIRKSHEEKGYNVQDEITPVAPVAPVAHLAHRTPAKTVRTWKAKVIDATKIPREYMTVDQVKINEVLRIWRREVTAAEKAGKDAPPDLEIPGVEIKAEEDVRY